MTGNNGGKGGITKFGCVLYEFRGFFGWEYLPDPMPTRAADTDATNSSPTSSVPADVPESAPVSSGLVSPRKSTLSHKEAASRGPPVTDLRYSTLYGVC